MTINQGNIKVWPQKVLSLLQLIGLTIMLLSYSSASGQNKYLKDMEVEINYSGTDLLGLVLEIEKSSGFIFAYVAEDIIVKSVTIRNGTWNFEDLLKEISLQTKVSFKRINGTITIKPLANTANFPKVSDHILSQTIRGTVVDKDAKFPLSGVNIIVLNPKPFKTTATDSSGNFRMGRIPLGMVDLKLSHVGYRDEVFSGVTVTSGKEVVLQLNMQESILELGEVIIRPERENGALNNEMALVSGHSVSVEETHRYAGSFRDPARMVSSFAGVTSQPEGEGYNNDIVVRGNSPKYIQWRLEGIEIPNPSHFSKVDASGGAISALNSDLLANSDFYTGAFSPEYGDVLSGVFDVKLRRGNNEKREYSIGLGVLGTDMTMEGPFSSGYEGSYLLNYRYSTMALIDNIGIMDKNGVPTYQDAAFKFYLPTPKAGTFNVFGLGGKSVSVDQNYFVDSRAIDENLYMHANVSSRFISGSGFFTTGVNHLYSLSKNSALETTISYSGNKVHKEEFPTKTGRLYDFEGNYLRDTVSEETLLEKGRMTGTTVRGAIKFSSKINTKNKIEIGTKYSLSGYHYKRINYREDTRDWFNAIDFKENIGNLRSFVSWKFRLNEAVTFVSGIHHFHVFLNSYNSYEPRVAVKWQLKNASAFHAGFGIHSTMETISNYYATVEDGSGSVSQPNRDLSLLKARHYVLGYEKRLGKHMLAKLEIYYQDLYNLPVENDSNSIYSTINEINDFKNIELVNKGTGKNYGLEFTLERFFKDHYYFMMSSSLYNSKYKAMDGVERNTRYNGNYAFNFLCGKEFVNISPKRNKSLSLNTKVFFLGAKKIIPLLRDEKGEVAVDWENYVFYDYSKAYEHGLDNIFQINFSASYKVNNPKTTHEIALDIINLTNSSPRTEEYYVYGNTVGYDHTLSIIPNLIYRVHF